MSDIPEVTNYLKNYHALHEQFHNNYMEAFKYYDNMQKQLRFAFEQAAHPATKSNGMFKKY